MDYILTEKDFAARMALSNGYEIVSDAVYDESGLIRSAAIRWADDKTGFIRNVTSDAFGVSTIEFTRGETKYIIMSITRNSLGFILETNIKLIGFID